MWLTCPLGAEARALRAVGAVYFRLEQYWISPFVRTPQPNDGNYTRLPSIFELAQVYLGDQRGKWIRSYRPGNIPEVERKTLTHSSSKAFINPVTQDNCCFYAYDI